MDEITRKSVDAKNALAPLETRERELKLQQAVCEKESSKAAVAVSESTQTMDKLKALLEELDIEIEKNQDAIGSGELIESIVVVFIESI